MDLDALAKELDACQACALRQDAIGPVGWFGRSEEHTSELQSQR